MSGVLDSSKLPPEILILLSDINNYEDMEYDHVYRVLTSMTPETRRSFDEEAVNLHRMYRSWYVTPVESMDNATRVSILAHVQASLLLSCLRLVNRIHPQGGGGGSGGGGAGAGVPPAPNTCS